MADFHHLGIFLKKKRVDAGLTQMSLATKMGYPGSQFVSNWERCICPPPSRNFQKLIVMLKINKEELMEVMMEDSKELIMSKIYERKSRARKHSS